MRLTYNPGNNYEPTWAEDGRGIIYHYSYQSPDIHADDRCVGLLPPGGGTRLWQMCDERREHSDSADSFAGVAIGTDGRLLYLELSTRRGPGGLSGVNQPPQTRTLWLADTAFPFQRRKLLDLSFGLNLNGIFFNALRDVRWVGSTSFIALAAKQGTDINPWDSTLTGIAVVRGEITTAGATLSIVPGTEGATNYSLAENGVSLIITRSGLILERVPIAGSAAVPVATIPTLSVNDPSHPTSDIGNLTCSSTTCLATAGGVWQVDLTSGHATALATRITSARLSPASGDVAGTVVTSNVRIQVGGPVQPLSSIVLFHGVLP